MKIQFMGTAAAEGAPALFCVCNHCRYARARGGREIRSRAGSIIDGRLKLDFGPDSFKQMLDCGVDYTNLRAVLITHSHDDHFSAEAVRAIAPKRVYAHESWAAGIDAGHATAQGFSVAMVVAACIAAAGCALALVYSRAAVKRDAKRAGSM